MTLATTPAAGKTANYRPDIDGLRAIAVLLVVAFHTLPHALPGGYAGVDIFFVISGFLITGIILDALRRGTFSFLAFYARRSRRILPALLLVLGASLATAWLILLPDQLADFGKHLLGAALFSSNFLLWHDAGYFDTATMEKPLRHLWSLAVEEQFYLVWPLLLCWLYRSRLNIKKTLITLLLVSFAINVVRIKTYPDEIFYLLPGRFWELLAGGLLAQLAFEQQNNPPSSAPKYYAIATVALSAVPPLLLGIFLLFLSSAPFPGWAGLLPVLAAVVFIRNGPESFWNRLLSHPVFVYIGKISYPLYLWHWPLLSLSYIHSNGAPNREVHCALAALSFALAALTYHYLETPVKSRLFASTPQPGRSVLWVGTGAAGLIVAGLAGWYAFNRPWPETMFRMRSKPQNQFLLKTENFKTLHNMDLRKYVNYTAKMDKSGCFADNYSLGYDRLPEECRSISAAGDKMVFVWGDSFSERIMHGLKLVFRDNAITVRNIGVARCPPVVGLESDLNPLCHSMNDRILDFLKHQKPHTLLLAANWTLYTQRPEFRSGFERTVNELKTAGIRDIVVYGQTPVWGQSLYHILLDRGRETVLPERIEPSPKSFTTDRLMRQMTQDCGAQYAQLLPQFCDGRGCAIFTGGESRQELFCYDSNHLTDTAAEYIAGKVLAPVLLAGFTATTSTPGSPRHNDSNNANN